jgi:(1->4)-alpha-D-glucan 1-alpha-D-glucosylmutase
MLADLRAEFTADPRRLLKHLAARWPGDEIKQFTLWRALQVRQSHADLVTYGEYIPLEVEGRHSEHLFAFARRLVDQWLIAAVPRQTHLLRLQDPAGMVGPGMLKVNWHDTSVLLPEGAPADWTSAWDQEVTTAGETITGRLMLRATDLLLQMPVALLVSPSTE